MTDGDAGDADGSGDETAAGDRSTPAESAETSAVSGDSAATDESGNPEIRRCDYCRLPIPADVQTLERDGITYTFCSRACKEALGESEHVFTQYHGFRRLGTGVSALDSSLPEGVPRNSFVMFTDLAGTRTEAVQAELVWRALQRGEPVVLVSFLEPPVSLVQEFVSLEWNVLPSLEDGDLHILDCFTYRLDDRDRMTDGMSTWNAHLQQVAKQSTTTVRDPSDVSQLENRLDGVLDDMGMQDRGIVVMDTLTELGSLVQPVQAYNFVKNVRADVCKGRFVPIFASATVTGERDGFPHDLGYMVDGIVEMRVNDDLVEGALVKQVRVRKMSGVLTYPQWQSYEYTAGKGIVTFDPRKQLDEAAAERGEADADELSSEGGEASGDGQAAATGTETADGPEAESAGGGAGTPQGEGAGPDPGEGGTAEEPPARFGAVDDDEKE
jgi:KaiC/GvpD/RAD55 family RecA-like ATPase